LTDINFDLNPIFASNLPFTLELNIRICLTAEIYSDYNERRAFGEKRYDRSMFHTFALRLSTYSVCALIFVCIECSKKNAFRTVKGGSYLYNCLDKNKLSSFIVAGYNIRPEHHISLP